GFEKPDNPFNKKQVREAVSLALDRRTMSQAEEGGLSNFTGNWIPDDWPGAIEAPEPEFNLQRAQQLMAEAGFPNGFEVDALTPLPPYFSLGERVVTAIREIGIRTRLQTMERGAFLSKLGEGPEAFSGIVLNVSAAPGDAASRVRALAICGGSSSRTCVPEIDEPFKRYEASTNPQEREQLLRQVQQYMIDNYTFVSIYRAAFINAQGPKVLNKWDEIIGAVPQYVYIGPYEDIQVRE
ncbi:MAG TPA: ABC transporter substrate-binding protein, partial [Dehalococcoidia bacterium]|nr:ABC transporter substrate-binding protein [Dehalococcoidia bacterium]